MADYQVGAHTYIFTEYRFDPDAQFDEIYDTIAQAGYETIEVYPPNLDVMDWRPRTETALARTGMRLIGGSHGGPLWDIPREAEILAAMDAYAAKLAALGDKMLCGYSCSGKRLAERTPAENDQALKMWARLGEMLRDRGVILNYHTHGEPPEDVAFVVDNVPPEVLALGPDLDWLRFGGGDPEAFVRTHAERIVALHVRDYHVGGSRTEALGEGDADYARLGALLDEVGFAGEFIIELALPPGQPPTRSVGENLRLSREHVRRAMGL